jgi:signal transduction histidine kinase
MNFTDPAVLAAAACAAALLLALPLAVAFAAERRRRAAETRLADSERRHQALAENLSGLLFQGELTESGSLRCERLDGRAADVLGVDAEAARRDPALLLAAVHPDDRAALAASIADAARGAPWCHEFRVVPGDGATRWLKATAAPRRRADGRVVWDGFVADESERKAAELALGVANSLLALTNERLARLYDDAHQFVDDVAHEFRTPLTVIREFAAIMEEGLSGDLNDEQRRYLQVICARVDDLNGLVNDMLDLSRLEAGLMSAARREHPVGDILDRIEPLLIRRAAAGGVALAFEIEDGLPPVYGDAEKIGRVLVNLAINAFKYGGERGGVTLWARHLPASAQVEFGVTDNGPGIPAEKLGVIFERFKQAGRLRDTAKGFGLGLSIVRELVDLNLGEVQVESEPGKGSTFSFAVPAFDPPAILARYAAKLTQRRPGPHLLAGLRVSLAPGAGAGVLAEFDAVLQQQVAQGELLLRLEPHGWTLLIPDKQEAEAEARALALGDRIRADYGDIGDTAPALDIRPLGIWRLPGQLSDLLHRLAPAAAAPARKRA